MKRVLYFFPDDIGRPDAGNKTRAIELLNYFRAKKISVDFATLKSERRSAYDEAETLKFIKEKDLADDVFFLPRKPVTSNPLIYFLRYKLWDLFYYLFTFPSRSSIPTFLTIALKQAFEKLLINKQYDYIIISYAQCADLISNKKLTGNASCIIDTHDFITAQFKGKRNFNLGATFEDEINRLNLFDQIWAISADEQFVYSQFCKSEVRFVPMSLQIPAESAIDHTRRKYDIIYVASDNVHNQQAAKWFFTNVYPLIPAEVKICVIGKINNYLTLDERIDRFKFVDDLSLYYDNAKIAICPMLTGTGIKIKVIEALSHGLPVVCNTRGVDGLPDKTNSGCIVTDDAKKFSQNLMLLLNNADVYNMMSARAKQTFNTTFSRMAVHASLDRIFNVNS